MTTSAAMFSLVLFGIAAGALCAQPSLRTEGGKMQFAAGAGKVRYPVNADSVAS